MGDGESAEGTTWETALFAAQHQLDNLIVVLDRNHMQGLGDTEKILSLEPLMEKWDAFGWDVARIDGHSHEALHSAFESFSIKHQPHCLIADTIKGYGVSFMENKLEWHYKPPVGEQFDLALQELEEDQP